jgi:tetratricopeptide (TPR) repeat protein
MRVDDRGAGNESNKHGQQVCRSLPADEKLRANVRSFFQAPWLRLLLLIVSHIFRAVLRNLGMKPFFGMSLIFFGLATAMPVLRAQAQGGNGTPNSSQSNQAASPQSPDSAKQPAQVHSQSNANPFPEDTSNVPVMPTHDIPGLPPDAEGTRNAPVNLPGDDMDPVRSPEDEGAAAQGGEGSSSSSMAGMGDLLPGPDDESQPGKRNRRGSQGVLEHHETAAEDENVGSYYLSSKNWKAALSRYQSAMVLDPDNPVVYWGLAESQRHLGDFADARANYEKVVEYDPDSRQGKDARKALNEPEIANAKAPAKTQSVAPTQ